MPERKLINTPAKHRPLASVTCKHDRPLGQAHILFEQHKIYMFLSTSYLIGLILTWRFGWSHLEVGGVGDGDDGGDDGGAP